MMARGTEVEGDEERQKGRREIETEREEEEEKYVVISSTI